MYVFPTMFFNETKGNVVSHNIYNLIKWARRNVQVYKVDSVLNNWNLHDNVTKPAKNKNQ